MRVGVEATSVKRIDLATARDFIEEYEWLGNVGSSQRCYGLFHQAELLAVCCFTRVMSPGGFRRLLPLVAGGMIYQLCRGATAPFAPAWASSRLIARALRLLRRETGAELVVAYADPRAGELGVVYRAANALYLGMTDARGPGAYRIAGQLLHPRTVYRRYGSASHETLSRVDPNYQRLQRNKKHRFVFVLATGRRRAAINEMLEPMVRAAPRRVTSVMEPA